MLRSNAMTIGQLSRRTGVPVKILRHYEDLGFLYTLGRSETNYRLFGEEALWCVQVIEGLRSLGLTLKEIRALVRYYLERPSGPSGDLLEAQLAQALARVEIRITTLQSLRQRILEFQAACAGAPARCLFAGAVVGTRPTPLRVAPRHLPLDSPPRGRVYTLSVALLGNPGMKAP